MSTTPSTYAIVCIISGQRRYWHRKRRIWTNFYDATNFTKGEKRSYKLPASPIGAPPAEWVSVLHGMGDTFYPAASVLAQYH